MERFLPLIILGIIYVVMRAVAGAAGQGQKGRAPTPPRGTGRRPTDTGPEVDGGATWEAPREQVDRLLDQVEEKRAPTPGTEQQPTPPALGRRVGLGQVPPMPPQQPRPMQPPQTRPIPQMPPPGGRPQRPTSPLEQLMQLPQQLAQAQQTAAEAQRLADLQQAELARREAELERQRALVQNLRAELRRQAAADRRVQRQPAREGMTFGGPEDLRRAIVFAEVLGPAKALRRVRRPRTGTV